MGVRKKKKFVLVEFPYPSGAGLHMGHLRPYVAADVYSRFQRMKGQEVLFPMGWDAFGLPAENYAIKMGVHPTKTTAQNIKNAKKQIQSWGLSFDWNREINTTDPNYYKWTQWLFLQFYKAGLAYEATGLINWCPKDKTGLANEEVIDGKCERCGTEVEKKELRQWYLKITQYAEKLLQGLKDLDQWPEAVKLQQENWIGKSVGATIKFSIFNSQFSIEVFTTRPDTIFGATYMVLAPEHQLIQQLKDGILNWDEVSAYIEKASKEQEKDRTAEGKEKTGVELQGVKAINPATKEEIPVWIADYVLGNYGTGAIMAVPAHDQRDFEFAQKFGLPIKQVAAPYFEANGFDAPKPEAETIRRDVAWCLVKDAKSDRYLVVENHHEADVKGYLAPSGGVEEGETLVEAGVREIYEETGYKNARFVKALGDPFYFNFYKKSTGKNHFIRMYPLYFEIDNQVQEAISKQELEIQQPVWIEKKNIEQLLSTRPFHRIAWNRLLGKMQADSSEGILINSRQFDGLRTGEAIPQMGEKFGKLTTQYKLRDWVFSRQRYWGEPIPIIHCEKCGIVPVPEKDLPVKLPPVKKYEPTGTGESPLAAIKTWVNTKCPKCKGKAKRETNTMPQWAGSSWYWLRYVDPKNKKEFSSKPKQKYWTPVDVYFGGMEHTTLHLLYSRFWNLFLYDKKLVTAKEPYKLRKPHGIILGPDGEKMSKSRGNVVNPDDVVKKFGADTLRMYELFLGPHEAMVAWNDQGIIGTRRFLDRIWGWVTEKIRNSKSEARKISNSGKVEIATHKLIKKITEDIENFRFNTSISSFMEFHNEVKDEPASPETVKIFLTLLYPFAPHISEELWSLLGNKKSLQLEPWPKFNPKKITEKNVEIVVQINGKVRGKISVPFNADERTAKDSALAQDAVINALAGESIKRIIFVPNRIINLVV